MFSGGSYAEVARWLRMFLTSHAKREDPRLEVALEDADAREGRSYGARLLLGSRASAAVEFEYAEVAASRGSLAWCAAAAERVRALGRAMVAQA